ncbi:MAG: hypothetical protein H2057_04620 [Alphaproteobacteria bacterium]|nr:hypothetical protein [Alphaproteobacteria bacterium]
MKNTLTKVTFVAALLTAVYSYASTPPTIQCPDLTGKTIGEVFGETLPPMNKVAKDIALPGLPGWLFSGFVTPSAFKAANTFQLIGHAANTRCNYYVVENGGHKGSVAFTQDPNAAPTAEPAAEPAGEPAAEPAGAKPEDEKAADEGEHKGEAVGGTEAAAGAKPEEEKSAAEGAHKDDAAGGTEAVTGAKPEEEKPAAEPTGKS